ncbi:MAG: HD-GYP domain-containing protein, partial [Caldisericaceae bacterium]
SFYLQINLLLRELKKISEEEKAKASNLKLIVELMTATTFTETVEEFFSKLLSFTLSLVSGGETGSVWLPYDGEMKCIAAIGFDKEKLNKIIKVDRKTHEEMSKKQKVNLIDSIGKRNLVDEIDENVMNTKHTLAGTFWVEGEYYGSLFVDTTRLDIPFKTEDFELLYAVSNFGSLFLQTHKLFKELKDELAVDSLALKISKSGNTEEEVSSFLRNVYKLLTASLKDAIYMKLHITVEGQCKQIFVDSNKVLLQDCIETNSDFDFKAIPIVYETQNAQIEVGTLNPLDKNIISQIEVAILPIIERFFAVKEIKKLFADVMFAFAKAIDSKDPYTRLHSENVTKYAFFFGKYLNLDIDSLKKLVFASILHDVGKIGVNDAILLKKEPLGKEDMDEIKKHPLKSYEIISTIGALDEVARIVLHHHERYDGKGYPYGLKNGEIPYLSRILSIVDAFDAMTTDRPYRKARSIDEAMEEILKNGGAQFDMELAKKFFELKDSIKEAFTTDFDEILAYILKLIKL